jgi:hypothetical protein
MRKLTLYRQPTPMKSKLNCSPLSTHNWGMVPNFLKVFAHSPTVLRAFLGLHEVASEGSLDPLTKASQVEISFPKVELNT